MTGNRRCLILYLMEYFEDNKGEKVIWENAEVNSDEM